jgi:hypothetical protein
MYCLRKTHISWARQITNPDSVRLQVGHAARDVEEKHYLDLVDARLSSQAVWDVLTGKKKLPSLLCETVLESTETEQNQRGMVPNVVHESATAANLELKTDSKEMQPVAVAETSKNIPGGTRTHDLRFRKPSNSYKSFSTNNINSSGYRPGYTFFEWNNDTGNCPFLMEDSGDG